MTRAVGHKFFQSMALVTGRTIRPLNELLKHFCLTDSLYSVQKC